MKKKMILGVILFTLAGCGTKQTSKTSAEIVDSSSAGAPTGPSLFREAHRCQGIVKYQAEMQKGEMRSRLSCEWTVEPDEWGAW